MEALDLFQADYRTGPKLEERVDAGKDNRTKTPYKTELGSLTGRNPSIRKYGIRCFVNHKLNNIVTIENLQQLGQAQ